MYIDRIRAFPSPQPSIRQHSVWVGLLLVPALAAAVEVTPGEMAEARQWASAKFEGVVAEHAVDPALVVLANHDPVQKNARGGRPMRLANKEFSRGLYCHAPSRIVVRLPAPGAAFSAMVGVDSNEQTSGGRGSVELSVGIGDAVPLRSGVLREGMAPMAVAVDLAGATEFTLKVDETPDGITCDQADWADAKVTLRDGRELWLAELPLCEGERPPVSAAPPFSFTYDGRPSAELLDGWTLRRASRPLDSARVEHTLTWKDPQTQLAVRCVGIEYRDFPTVEWTVHFKNEGPRDSPPLADVRALDTRFERGREFTLHHHQGTFVRADDFMPLTTVLTAGQPLRFAPPGGRPLGQVFPYFNLEAQGGGVIVVGGWPGQWAAEFARDGEQSARVTAGQELLRSRLKPGEEIRTPLIVLQFWQGNWIRAQNLWRRWMQAHSMPRPGGKPIGPLMAACSSHQFAEMIQADEANQKFFVDRYLEEKLPLDYWWMDAGWYRHDGAGWPHTGTWEVDTDRFPHGLRAISDHARAKWVKTIVWFEPERVALGTDLYTNHPTWLLGKDGDQKLLNLGHPEAQAWLIDHIGGLIQEQGIDLYRQDYNIDPLAFWRGADAVDRQGITENHYVTGYLAFWDALLKRFPDLLIDSCASGGHRNDLETLRRAVPLLRSDYLMEPVGQQGHTYGLALWMPFFGTGTSAMDSYHFRSQMGTSFNACYDMRRHDLPFDEARRLVGQWKNDVAPNYFGDFYPLTPYSLANDIWLAWQFDRPEAGVGIVQAFRRADCIYESARLKLFGLDPAARYATTDLDHPGGVREIGGGELMDSGLLVTATNRPAAIVLTYRKLK
jgi:alpha-galactosidase